MKYRIVKDELLSGDKATIYQIEEAGSKTTLLEEFINENDEAFPNDVIDITRRLKSIGHKFGAVVTLFKDKEGVPGDGVCAIFDLPGKNLRLYCIRYGTQIIIVGSGGIKSKSIKSFQENEKLTEENYFLRWLSQQITTRIKSGEIKFTKDYYDFEGDLYFDFK